MRKLVFALTVLTAFAFIGNKNRKLPLKVLFLGNSYVYVNELPELTSKVASSAGDSLIVDSYSPAGYTLQQHSRDSNSIKKIKSGAWNYIILQDNSRRPSFPDNEVKRDVFPYAKRLDSLIHLSNPKSTTVFYMTWARKNGDTSRCPTWPPACSYRTMDSVLALRYVQMAKTNHAKVSPVGAVWKYLRTYNPEIELYQQDESHPSKAGSYAAACSFYTSIFQKDPGKIKYNYTLANQQAEQIRRAVRLVVYNHLKDWSFN